MKVTIFCLFYLNSLKLNVLIVGARVRRMAFGTFSCYLPDTQTKHTEVNLLCLTNLGDCVVLSIPDLKRQLNAAAVRREDIKYVPVVVIFGFYLFNYFLLYFAVAYPLWYSHVMPKPYIYIPHLNCKGYHCQPHK